MGCHICTYKLAFPSTALFIALRPPQPKGAESSVETSTPRHRRRLRLLLYCFLIRSYNSVAAPFL